MKRDQIWNELMKLPPEVQQQVFDFITFLRSRYVSDQKAETKKKLSEESFIGMWQDRQDMTDSSEWVRNIRQQEWG